MTTTDLARRTVAVVAAGGGVGHLAMAATGGWAFALMGVLCLPCAVHLWRHDTRRSWSMVAFGAVGMVAVHIGLVVHSPAGSGHHHLAVTATSSHSPAHLLVLTMLEALVVAGVLWAAPSPSPILPSRSTP
ncbi:hypothetical protein [Amycolatopsis sp. NPDC098790]|uniref:hypothetical protein n=1 Tax=Amycolatopsis sp. NPDC098790 TaxID=3363939 RepID=UPI00382FAA82